MFVLFFDFFLLIVVLLLCLGFLDQLGYSVNTPKDPLLVGICIQFLLDSLWASLASLALMVDITCKPLANDAKKLHSMMVERLPARNSIFSVINLRKYSLLVLRACYVFFLLFAGYTFFGIMATVYFALFVYVFWYSQETAIQYFSTLTPEAVELLDCKRRRSIESLDDLAYYDPEVN